MPPVVTSSVVDFLNAAARSGLLPEERLQRAVRAAPAAVRRRSDLLADYLVRNGMLSSFQAVKLLAGAERGLVLGPYRILAPLGRGGMGAVYLARDARDQRLVALKILPPQRYRHEERQLARFRREMEICQRVAHPHLTRTFEAGVVNDVYYIAMEYVPGKTLRRQIIEDGPLPVGRAARLFGQVAAALEHAHLQGLVHRDLKPGNIMITPNGHAKVLDLGLALIEGEELPADRSIVGGRGYVVGTMDFIAPEQVADPTAIDGRADLYALGCSLYYTLTGQVPFPGGTSQQKVRRHLNETPAPVTDLNPTVPAGFARLIGQLMAKRPESRPPRADDVRRWLRHWSADEPEPPMDVAADNSNPREVVDLEEDQPAAGSFWDSVPVSVFINHQPRAGLARAAAASSWNRRLLMLTGALAGLFFLLILLAVGLAIVLK